MPRAKLTKNQTKILYSNFLFMFPELGKETTLYGPYDNRTIWVETPSHERYYFEYISEKEWQLTTEKIFFNSRPKHVSL